MIHTVYCMNHSGAYCARRMTRRKAEGAINEKLSQSAHITIRNSDSVSGASFAGSFMLHTVGSCVCRAIAPLLEAGC